MMRASFGGVVLAVLVMALTSEAAGKRAGAAAKAAKSAKTAKATTQTKKEAFSHEVKALRAPTAQERALGAAWYGKALRLFDAGRVSEAKAALAKSMIFDAASANAHLLAGSIAQDEGNANEAARYYKRYLAYARNGKQMREVSKVLQRMKYDETQAALVTAQAE